MKNVSSLVLWKSGFGIEFECSQWNIHDIDFTHFNIIPATKKDKNFAAIVNLVIVSYRGEGDGGREKGIVNHNWGNQEQIWDISRWVKIKTIQEMSNCQSWSRLIISTTKFLSAIWSITQVSTRFERWRVLHNFFGRAREIDIFCILEDLHFCICSLAAL